MHKGYIKKYGKKIMKILFFEWHSFMNKGMERALVELGIEYKTFFYQFDNWEKDDAFLENFRKELRQNHFDCVLSVNFAPLISQVCEELGIRYVSWVYDSPLHIRNLEPLKNSCNEVYFFDRGQAEIYHGMGVDARHMPLAVDTKVFADVITAKSSKEYGTDVSLIGKLYQTEYQYFTSPLDSYLKGYLEGIVNSQMKIYGGYLIPELVTDELLKKMNTVYRKVATDGFQMGRRELEFMLACETTGRERYLALALLSKHFQVDLYSNNKDDRLKDVRYRGYADYYTQMPQIFASSRINLNISLKTIRTGIPLRVIDVMGCGGFVLTNYQQEITEYFAVGEECVVYENIEDLYAKAAYYLEHEEERKRIAQAGYERVKRDFTFKERLGKML